MAEDSDNGIEITRPGIIVLGDNIPDVHLSTALFQDTSVTHVSCGTDHSAVVLASGQVYVLGRNQDNGWVENNPDVISPPILMSSLQHVRIVAASCGNQFTFFLTEKGELYSRGENENGQLGLGHKTTCPTPVLVTGLPPVKKVAAGNSHTLVLTETGEVWGAGCNDDGQLGLGDEEDHTTFVPVPNLPNGIKDISCGSYHSALLTSSRVILIAGRNTYGQLGMKKGDNVNKFIPVSVPSAPIAAMSCGADHTVALRVDGSIWAWGDNGSGQLATNNEVSMIFTPSLVCGFMGCKITDIIAGGDRTALMTSEGDVLWFGCGTNGELGPVRDDIFVPTRLKKLPELIIRQVAFTEMYSMILVGSKEANPSATTEQSVPKNQLKENRASVSEIEENILKSLECPVCIKVMSPPIHLCSNGHSVCATCRSTTVNCSLCREFYVSARNVNLENLSMVVPLPCVDCLERMPANLLDTHGSVCAYRNYDCPIEMLCGWNGRPEAMLGHASSSHPNQTWQKLPCCFTSLTSESGAMHKDLLSAYGELFTLHRRYDKNSGKFQAFVTYIGPQVNVEKFRFEITFLTDEHHVTMSFCSSVFADIGDMKDNFQSTNCILLKKDLLRSYIHHNKLVYEINIIRSVPETRDYSSC